MFGLKTSRKNVIQTNLTKRFPQERCLKVGKMGPPLHKQQMSESKGRDWIEVACDVILSTKLTTISLQLLLACYCGVVCSVFFVHFFERPIWFKTVEQKDILDGNGTAFIPYDEDLEPNATVEAAAAFEESVILEEDRNLQLQRHFTGEIGAW